jgi:E3 ubiquitin-protein ligase FANCL
MTDQDMIAAGRSIDSDEEIAIQLISGSKDVSTTPLLDHHPCGELIRTARNLEKLLHERLKDASSGALGDITDGKGQLGVYEEFLQRSEAIVNEFLGAIQQHLRKEQTTSERARAMNSINRKRHSSQSDVATSPPPLSYYAALLRQLKILDNMPNVTEIDLHNNNKSTDRGTTRDITRLSVTYVDGGHRSHTWHAELYPTIVLTVDLPEDFSIVDSNLRLERWWDDDKHNTVPILPEIQRRFQRGIDMYQPLFNELDELDVRLWILEPSLPARRSSVERRIALWEGGASMVIVLDPEKPRCAPVLVRFVGLTAAAMAAAQIAKGNGSTSANGGKGVDWSSSFADFVAESVDDDSNTERWLDTRSVQENIEIWFGAPLPSPLSSVKSDYLVECGICYTHRLPAEDSMTDDATSEEGALPDVKCNNASCNKHYHESCLFEWLHSLPMAKNSFDRIFGSCPYCCETVSVGTSKSRHK